MFVCAMLTAENPMTEELMRQLCLEGARRFTDAGTKLRQMEQALRWCVVNDGETLGDHPNLLRRFREILGMQGETDG